MKKLLLFLYCTLSVICLTAQIDTTGTHNALVQGGVIFQTIAPRPWINGITNEALCTLITLVTTTIFGLFHRKTSLNKLRKEGKLND